MTAVVAFTSSPGGTVSSGGAGFSSSVAEAGSTLVLSRLCSYIVLPPGKVQEEKEEIGCLNPVRSFRWPSFFGSSQRARGVMATGALTLAQVVNMHHLPLLAPPMTHEKTRSQPGALSEQNVLRGG